MAAGGYRPLPAREEDHISSSDLAAVPTQIIPDVHDRPETTRSETPEALRASGQNTGFTPSPSPPPPHPSDPNIRFEDFTLGSGFRVRDRHDSASTPFGYRSGSPTTFVAPEDQSETQPLKPKRSSTASTGSFWTYRQSLPDLKEAIRYSLTPEYHVAPEKILPARPATQTAKLYSKWTQSKRLWRLATCEWLMTALFCAFYGLTLSIYNKRSVMDNNDKLTFNALTSALSFALGVNLAASLRSYAKLLRWLILSMAYRPLETFDLVLGCDSFANILSLLIKGGNKGKNRPSRTQVFCLLWLCANLSTMLAVTCVSLTYSIDNASIFLKTKGIVYVTDFDALWTREYPQTISEAQTWGEKAFRLRGEFGLGYGDQPRAGYTTAGNGTSQIWLHLWNLDDADFHAIKSRRRLRTTAVCTEFKVIEGEYGNVTSFVYQDEASNAVRYHIPWNSLPGPGGLLASSQANSTCGSRCTTVDLFMARTATYTFANTKRSEATTSDFNAYPINEAKFFRCNNTVDHVFLEDSGAPTKSSDDHQFNDTVAQVLAGSIGWSNYQAMNQSSGFSYMAYHDGSEIISGEQGLHMRYPPSPSVANMSDFVSSFTTKAVALLDDWWFGLPAHVKVADDQTPVPGLRLTVDWRNAIWMLAAIPGMQFLCLVLVFVFANRAIIKDDSHLSMAKLYFNLLKNNGMGDVGCMLRRDELVRVMGFPHVAYGWMEGTDLDFRGRAVGHIDVFDTKHKEASMTCKKDFEDGRLYDGLGDGALRQRASPLHEDHTTDLLA